MDLRKEWQKLQEEKFNQSQIKKEDIMNAIYQESQSTISTLKTRLKSKMNWCLFFVALFVGIMVYHSGNKNLLILISGFLVAYLVVYFGMFLQHRQMGMGDDFSQMPLAVMKENYKRIKTALTVEKVFGLLIFAPAILGGLMYRPLLNGETFGELFSCSEFLTRAIVLIVVLLPAMYFLTNKMNQHAYGKLMENLSNNIRRLEDLS